MELRQQRFSPCPLRFSPRIRAPRPAVPAANDLKPAGNAHKSYFSFLLHCTKDKGAQFQLLVKRRLMENKVSASRMLFENGDP